jgi:hypothetical protein
MAGRVAAWSDVWPVMDPRVTASLAAQLPGVTKITVGMAMLDGLTMEAWLDTPSALAAKNLAARLQKNPQGTPLFGKIGGATSAVEQREVSVRAYACVSGSQLRGFVAARQIDGMHKLTLAGGKTVCSRSVVIATGAQYRRGERRRA